MQKNSDQESNVNNLCRCPHCSCCFCTESDLKRHLERFGYLKGEHLAEFQRVHGRLEHGSIGGPE